MARDLERRERVKCALADAGLEGLVCALPMNLLLLAGYWPTKEGPIAIFTREGQLTLLAPADEGELAECAGADEVRIFEASSLERLQTTLEAVAEPLQRALREAGLDRGVIGCESRGVRDLVERSVSTGSVRTADAMLAWLRAVKTEIELDRIRRACRIAECAYLEGSRHLRAGIREPQAAEPFRSALSTQGIGYEGVARADGFVFCMSGANAAAMYGGCGRSHGKEIVIADLVLTHSTSYADGYWAEISRTYSIGEPDERRRQMYAAVLEARQAALHAVRTGALAADIDRAAREVLRGRGFAEQFRHPAGHGVGFTAGDAEAPPRLHPKSQDRLEGGMVFNLEPGIYFAGEGGLRHGDMVAVTDTGAELLTPFQATLEELIV